MDTREVFQMVARILNARPPDKIRSRVQAKTCLHCAKPAERRGLCKRHYFAFRRALAGKSLARSKQFETKAIR